MRQISQLLTRVAARLAKMHLPPDGEKIVVAVSGGPDSLALLHILRELLGPAPLIAASINHGLRPTETPMEEELIADCCRRLAIPWRRLAITVPTGGGESREEAARRRRYEALEKIRRQEGAGAIALGHTADDQVEEFFLRLLRGSGTKALSGMRAASGRLLRPLLAERKATLIAYLREKGERWCVDSTNQDYTFFRNRVRGRLLPLLAAEFNPAINRTILRSMDILATEDDYLAGKTRAACRRLLRRPTAADRLAGWQWLLPREGLERLHPALRRRVVEACCWRLAIRPAHRQIIDLLDLLAVGRVGSRLHLSDGVRAVLSAEALLLGRPLPAGQQRGDCPPPSPGLQTIDGPGCYRLPEYGRELLIFAVDRSAAQQAGELRLDRQSISFPLILRPASPGERFRPAGSAGHKKVFRYLQERQIAAGERWRWPLLVMAEEKIVALPGLAVDHGCRPVGNNLLAIVWRPLSGSR